MRRTASMASRVLVRPPTTRMSSVSPMVRTRESSKSNWSSMTRTVSCAFATEKPPAAETRRPETLNAALYLTRRPARPRSRPAPPTRSAPLGLPPTRAAPSASPPPTKSSQHDVHGRCAVRILLEGRAGRGGLGGASWRRRGRGGRRRGVTPSRPRRRPPRRRRSPQRPEWPPHHRSRAPTGPRGR